MKNIVLLVAMLLSLTLFAQDDDCMELIMAKEGAWKKLSQTIRSPAADYAVQQRFYNAFHQSLAGMKPKGWQAEYSGSFLGKTNNTPVPEFMYTLYAMMYACNGKVLGLNHETNTKLFALFNRWDNLGLYENGSPDSELGFETFRDGMPTEVKPGVWQFAAQRQPLGFGIEGLRKTWLFTYAGQLPWSWVSRREFLEKRRRILLAQLKENESKPDDARLTNELTSIIEAINEQLEAGAAELKLPAAVSRSTKRHNEFLFVEPGSRGAVLLIKPNPAYFKKGLPAATPQFFKIDLTFNPNHPVSAAFARDVEKQLDLIYLQSFIGKTAPPAFQSSSSVEKEKALPVNNPAAIINAKSPELKSGKQAVTKPLTPQGPLSNNGVTLSGTLSAPAGVLVTLAFNGGNDLIITPSKGKGNLYNSTPFRFPKPLKDGEDYDVTFKKVAGNMKGVVYSGKGKAPGGADGIKIGVDYNYELVTHSSDDAAFSSFYETGSPAVGGMGSEEGRYVAFASWTKGFAGNDGKFRQVFWRDRNTGETKLISKSLDGTNADADCGLPTMSADGQIVVFESKASNLISGDNNGKKDIFLWRAKTGTIELVSVPAADGSSNGDSYDAMISGDGNFVVFTSDAVNMTATPKGKSLYNVFLRDVANGKTEMLSVDPNMKTGGNGGKASISFDGSRVSFCSPSPTLVANDNNGLWDIFLWEKAKSGLRRISLTHDGKERQQGDESGSRQVASTLSGNGRYVVYATTAPNMVPGDNLKYQDVFVYDIDNNKLQVASFTNEGQPGNHDSPIEQGERIAITHDGTWVAFPTKATNLGVQSSNILLYNTQTGKKQIVTNTRGSYVSRPSISYSGSYVVFGKSEALDQRAGAPFGEGGGGIFAHFTGLGPCRDCR